MSNVLVNGNFDEDAANIGFPDHWTSADKSKVELTNSSERGSRIVRLTEARAEVSQGFEVSPSASRTLRFSIFAKGGDGAQFEAFLKERGKGNRTFPLLKSQLAPHEWSLLSASVSLPRSTAKEFDLVIRKGNTGSGNTGTLWVDDATLTVGDLGPEADLNLTRELREWNYLATKAKRVEASSLQQSIADESRKAIAILEKWDESAVAESVSLRAKRLHLAAKLLAHANDHLIFSLEDPLERLNPAGKTGTSTIKERVLLKEEPALIGFRLGNPSEEALNVAVQVERDGKPLPGELRRQVFMETWYTKGKTRVADPMVLCPPTGAEWSVSLAAAEEAQFLVEIPASELPAGESRLTIKVRTPDGKVSTLEPIFNVLDEPMPTNARKRFDYMAFCYPGVSVMEDPIDDSLKDMEALGVTAFEYAFLPTMRLGNDGALKSILWKARHEKWLKAIAPTSLDVVMFWEPGMKKLKAEDGTPLEVGTPAWRRAYREIIASFIETAANCGVKKERLIHLAKDEAFSRNQQAAPDEHMTAAVEMFRLSKEYFPEIRTLATVTYYAYLADLQAMLPYVDIVMPHWPYPTRLTRFASPDYNPRSVLQEKIMPLFQEKQKEIWSYNVANGKTQEVLSYNLAYPSLVALAGMTGAGHWAYANPSGSSWDDTDGKILDYILVYDGREDHPMSREWNATGERIVPSIRWFGLREGLNDGRLLLLLQDELKRNSGESELTSEIKALVESLRTVAGPDGYGTPALTQEWYRIYGNELRHLYYKAARANLNQEKMTP